MMSDKSKKMMWAYFFIAPTVILILLLNIWPIIQTFYLSFHEAKGLKAERLIGFANYIKVFRDTNFFISLRNTLTYVIITVPIGVFLSLVIAAMLNAKIKGKTFFRTLYFLPVVSAPAAVAMVWRWIYNSEHGILNHMLASIGIKGPNWIGDGRYVLMSIMIVGIWSLLGYNMVILLGGLQDIPKVYYEAAKIDGAGPISTFFKITVPMISPTLFFVVMTTTITAFQVFDTIFMMVDDYSPALKSAQSIVFMYYNNTFNLKDRGYGSTIAVLILFMTLILTAIQMKLQKKWVHYD